MITVQNHIACIRHFLHPSKSHMNWYMYNEKLPVLTPSCTTYIHTYMCVMNSDLLFFLPLLSLPVTLESNVALSSTHFTTRGVWCDTQAPPIISPGIETMGRSWKWSIS